MQRSGWKGKPLRVCLLVLTAVFSLCLAVSAVCLLLSVFFGGRQEIPPVFGVRIAVETAGRTESAAARGSAVFFREEETLSVGDAVVFRDAAGDLLCGRVKELTAFSGGSRGYVVSFDDGDDVYQIPASVAAGKVVWTVPLFGYLFDFFDDSYRSVVGVVVSGLLLLAVLSLRRKLFPVSYSKKEVDASMRFSERPQTPPEPKRDPAPAAEQVGLNDYWPAGKEDAGGAQDMIRTLSGLNDRVADKEEAQAASAAQGAEAEDGRAARRREAEELITGIKTAAESAAALPGEGELILSAEEAAALSGELASLGLREEESERILTALCREGFPPEQAEPPAEETAFPLPKVTGRSVDVDLEGRPTRSVRVVSEESGNYLIVESDQVETKIKLPF